MESDVVTLQDIFLAQAASGDGRPLLGDLQADRAPAELRATSSTAAGVAAAGAFGAEQAAAARPGAAGRKARVMSLVVPLLAGPARLRCGADVLLAPSRVSRAPPARPVCRSPQASQTIAASRLDARPTELAESAVGRLRIRDAARPGSRPGRAAMSRSAPSRLSHGGSRRRGLPRRHVGRRARQRRCSCGRRRRRAVARASGSRTAAPAGIRAAAAGDPRHARAPRCGRGTASTRRCRRVAADIGRACRARAAAGRRRGAPRPVARRRLAGARRPDQVGRPAFVLGAIAVQRQVGGSLAGPVRARRATPCARASSSGARCARSRAWCARRPTC